jgi:hypothetical protein
MRRRARRSAQPLGLLGNVAKHFLKRAVPNEQWHMILEFHGPEFRLFDASVLSRRWPKLAYPQYFKRFTVTGEAVHWSDGGRVDADDLYGGSSPQQYADLDHQTLRVSYKNQAPTDQDNLHHVYYVYVAPFSSKLFRIGESVGGGLAERGGGRNLTLEELLTWADWKHHFELSGCSWAVEVVESLAEESDQLVDALVRESCKRNGLPEDA